MVTFRMCDTNIANASKASHGVSRDILYVFQEQQKYIKAYTQTIESSPPKTRYMLIRSS